jgi:hypothetical protein
MARIAAARAKTRAVTRRLIAERHGGSRPHGWRQAPVPDPTARA